MKSIKLINFGPKKNNISNTIYNKNGELAQNYDDFVLVNKECYDKIKLNDINKVYICLVDNIFIYKVNENVLGIGIPEIEGEILPIFNIQFFIIITEKYIYIDNDEKIIFNSDSEVNEIFQCQDLEKYLKLSRKVEFSIYNFTKTDIEFNNNKIGILYKIRNFNIEKYWRRTEEKYIKKMNFKKSFKEPEIQELEEREKRNNDIKKIREIEKRQDAMFKRTMMEKYKNTQLKNNEIFKNFYKLKLLKKEEEKLKQIKNIRNTRYLEKKDLHNFEKPDIGMSNNKNYETNYISKDKYPRIPQVYKTFVLPLITERGRSTKITNKEEEYYLTYNNKSRKANSKWIN